MPLFLLPMVGATGLGVGWFGGYTTADATKEAAKYAAIAGVCYLAFRYWGAK